jgi:hypothetical protein
VRLLDRLSRRNLALLATLAVAGFVTLLALELWIDRIDIQTAALTGDIDALQHFLQQTSTLSSDRRELQERASRLHLTGDPGAQASVVIEVVEDIAGRNGLQLTLLRRQIEGNAALPPSPRLAHTVYSLALQGRYRSALSALNDLASAPLVSDVKAVSFERVQPRGSAAGIVRMTLELAVYRLDSGDVGARRS